MAKILLSSMKLNKAQLAIVEEFVSLYTDLHSVNIVQLKNKEIEFYTYKEGANRFSYDQCKQFDSKDFFVGYCKGYVDANTGNTTISN